MRHTNIHSLSPEYFLNGNRIDDLALLIASPFRIEVHDMTYSPVMHALSITLRLPISG